MPGALSERPSKVTPAGEPDFPVNIFGQRGSAVGAEIEQCQVAQPFKAHVLGQLAEIAGAAHRVDQFAEQPGADIPFANPRRLGDKRIRSHIGFQTMKIMGRDHAQFDVRVQAGEMRQARRQPQVSGAGRAADGQAWALVILLAQPLGGLGDVHERQLRHVEKQRAGGGQFHRAARTVEQLGAQRIFEFLDLSADGRRRYAQ